MGRREVERFEGVGKGVMGLLRLWKCVEKWTKEIEIRNTKLEIRNDAKNPPFARTKLAGMGHPWEKDEVKIFGE